MPTIYELIESTWKNLAYSILSNPAELKPRLARRRTSAVTAHPRAWCLAVRATDRRIHPWSAAISPQHAMDGYTYLPHPMRRFDPDPDAKAPWASDRMRPEGPAPQPHTVRLDPPLLRRLCRPVHIPAPGLSIPEVALLLGCEPCILGKAAKQHRFVAERALGTMARPYTRIYTDLPLDPAFPEHFQHPDPLWGTQSYWPAEHVPPDLEQTVSRVPVFRDGAKRESRQDRPERATRVDGPVADRPSHIENPVADSPRFAGWRWLCPACNQACKTLYRPLPRQWTLPLLTDTLLDELNLVDHFKELWDEETDRMPDPVPTFACADCHNIRHANFRPSMAWNHLVTHLSRGLLYGHEVPMPPDFLPKREKFYNETGREIPPPPKTIKLRSKHRPQVIELLKTTTLSYTQIAHRLGLQTKYAVYYIAKELPKSELTHRQRPPSVRKRRRAKHPAPHIAPGMPGGIVPSPLARVPTEGGRWTG